MIGVLPKYVEINGKNHAINSDYRIVLLMFEVFNDPDLREKEKAEITLNIFYKHPEKLTGADIQPAFERLTWFCNGGDVIKTKETDTKMMDWKQDESMIFSAVNKVAGQEVRALPYMHWWTFLGCFNEIGEGLFSTVLNIRQKRAKGKKLEKHEQEFYREHKEMINLYTEEEKAEIQKTRDVLAILLGEKT